MSISFIFVYFLRCLCNLNFKIEIRMQQHRGFEGAERDKKKKTKIVYIYMYVALFLFVAADWNYSNVLTLLFYFKQGNWCIVLRSDSYLNLFFRSNFTIILTTIFFLGKTEGRESNGFILLSNFCVCIKQMSDPGFLPAMHYELVLHFPHIYVNLSTRVLGHLSLSIKNKIIRKKGSN